MSDLTLSEQKHVCTGLRVFRRRLGAWTSVAEALKFSRVTLKLTLSGRRPVTATMAFRAARLLNVPIDDLLAGLPGACPRCGYMPDFTDEETVVGDVPDPAPGGGLMLVK